MDSSIEHRKPSRLNSLSYKGYYRYFITIRSYNFKPHFIRDEVVTKVIEILKNTATQEGFAIWAYCFMPDHLHLLIEGKKAEADMRRFTRLFKQKTGYWFKGIYGKKLWALNYYEHVLRDDEATLAVVRYIFRNPVRKGIVEDYSSYSYSGSFELEDISDL
jgi:putative transposase